MQGVGKMSSVALIPECIETDSNFLCDCEVLATLRFTQLHCYFKKQGGTVDIPVSRIGHFVQGAGMLKR